MPELPEVETVVRDLRPLIERRSIVNVLTGEKNLRRPWQREWSKSIRKQTIQAVRRRGKWIVVELDTNALLLHLGMTGQLTVHQLGSTCEDHTHLIWQLSDGHELRFRDVRRFGSADWFASIEELETFLKAKLGPEPFDLAADQFRESIHSSIRNLKALLLDQSIVAGVGNIYADEACFRAKLKPSRKGNSLSKADCDRLRECIVWVLEKAIAGRGSTIKDYIGGSGLMGTYQGEFMVYGRTDQDCFLCKSTIEMTRLAGRSSHFCPKCQR